MGSLKALLPYLGRYRLALVLGFGAMVLAIGFSRLAPWFMRLALDSLEALGPGGDRSPVYRNTAWMFLVALLGGAFLYFQRWLIIGTSRRVEEDLRVELFRRVQRMDLAFFDRSATGDLMSRFTNDLNALRDVAGPGLMYSFQMTAIVATTIGFMLSLDVRLTLLAILPYPLVSLVTYFYGRALHRRSLALQESFGRLSARAQEDIAGARALRAYGREGEAAERFLVRCEEYKEANLALTRLRAAFHAAITALAALGPVITLLVGGRMYMAGTLSLGTFVAFTVYLISLTWPVAAIGWVVSIIQRGASAMVRLREILEREPLIRSGDYHASPPGELVFDRVSFTYPGAGEPALRELSFRLAPGDTLGVTGPTGSGKSTLLKLILRGYDPTEGEIRLGGRPLPAWDLGGLRSAMGYAPQDSFLFSRTLAENIGYGRPGSSRERIGEAVVLAGLDSDLPALPQGLDTLIGERGVTLSGGQRQRASLARACLSRPDLLLLDDTLSSVDANKEARILANLRPLIADRTTVIISHRISAVRGADRILVLDEGRLVEEGRHGELLERDGLYAALNRRQQLQARIEGAR